MPTYKIFYSWQSDNKSARNVISGALNRAAASLSVGNRQIEVIQDSREGNGAENISVGLLASISHSDLFIGDLTPVTEYQAKDGIKISPNSNVMFEYGYAISQLGDSRCRQLAYLKDGHTMQMMPFDISQRKTIIISDANKKDLQKKIEAWILEKIVDIDKARQNDLPEEGAYISFKDDGKELNINPIFERITYHPKPVSKPKSHSTDTIVAVANKALTPDWIQASIDRMANTQFVKPQIAKPITETIYESRVPINLYLSNIGKEAIENIQIVIELKDENSGQFFEENKEESYQFLKAKSRYGSIFVDESGKNLYINYEILNPGMKMALPAFYLLTPFEQSVIELHWLVSTKSFARSGVLTINSEPQYEDISQLSNVETTKTEYREKITRL